MGEGQSIFANGGVVMDFLTFVVIAMTCGILLSVLLILFLPIIEPVVYAFSFAVAMAKAIWGEGKPGAL